MGMRPSSERHQRLGGISATPHGVGDAVAHLCGATLVGWGVEPDIADHQTVGTANHEVNP